MLTLPRAFFRLSDVSWYNLCGRYVTLPYEHRSAWCRPRLRPSAPFLSYGFCKRNSASFPLGKHEVLWAFHLTGPPSFIPSSDVLLQVRTFGPQGPGGQNSDEQARCERRRRTRIQLVSSPDAASLEGLSTVDWKKSQVTRRKGESEGPLAPGVSTPLCMTNDTQCGDLPNSFSLTPFEILINNETMRVTRYGWVRRRWCSSVLEYLLKHHDNTIYHITLKSQI